MEPSAPPRYWFQWNAFQFNIENDTPPTPQQSWQTTPTCWSDHGGRTLDRFPRQRVLSHTAKWPRNIVHHPVHQLHRNLCRQPCSVKLSVRSSQSFGVLQPHVIHLPMHCGIGGAAAGDAGQHSLWADGCACILWLHDEVSDICTQFREGSYHTKWTAKAYIWTQQVSTLKH